MTNPLSRLFRGYLPRPSYTDGSRVRHQAAASAPNASRVIIKVRSNRSRAFVGHLAHLWFAVLMMGNQVVAAAPVAVRVIDTLSGAPIIGQQVSIFERSANGSVTWRRVGPTAADGWMHLDVPAPAPGGRLLLRTKPFAQWIEREVPGTGNITLQAGPVRVDVRDGVSGAPLPGNSLLLLGKSADGTLHGIATVITEPDGSVRLDPVALGQEAYVLRGVSPVDGSNKYSAPITGPGTFTFALGNPPATVRLTDWSSAKPLVSQSVEVRERMADGTLVWLTKRTTDGDGRVRLDLDGLEAGRRYVVRMKPYLQWIERELTAAGWLSVRAGAVPVSVVNGDTGLPLAGTRVSLLAQLADGSLQPEFHATTGDDGLLHLDPSDLGGANYVLRAPSPVDGSYKLSSAIHRAGAMTFPVGNRGLTLRVVEAHSGQPRAALQFSAYEILPNGTRGPAIKRTTDATGIVKFDLTGLGNGQRYLVRTKPFLQWIERTIEAPGWLDIAVGQVKVNLVHGVSGAPLTHTDVNLLVVQPDSSRHHLQAFQSDANGSLTLDPPDLGDTRYALSAVSPSDGSTKFSADIIAPGDHTFAVGSAGVTLRVTDWAGGTPLAGLPVTAFEVAADGARRLIARHNTDPDGRATFDLDGLSTGRRYVVRMQPYLQWIEREVAATGFVSVQAGTVRATVLRGDNAQVLANTAVRILRILPDGDYEHVTTLITAANGELPLDLPDLGTTQYVLRAASPVDGTLKYSPPITGPGPVQFQVGNRVLRLTLNDGQSHTPLRAQAMQVYELQQDGTRTWALRRSTDEDGVVMLDLDGLGKGRNYVVRTKPYAQWIEQSFVTPGDFVMNVGSSPVTLTDKASGAPIADIEVRALNKASDGTLTSSARGYTDANGVVRFDPPALGNGGVVVYRAVDPFANGTNYYSKPTIFAGPFLFAVAREGPEPLDRTPAQLDVTLPRLKQAVSTSGFVLTGHAYDAAALREVVITVRNGLNVLEQVTANIDLDTRRWTARIGTLDIAPGTLITTTITATDVAYNVTTLVLPVQAMVDVSAPTIDFMAPSTGTTTHGQGLLVLGTVRDDTQWADIWVQLEDGPKILAPYRLVEGNPTSGEWAVAVSSDITGNAANLTVRMKAADVAGNIAEATRSFVVDPDGDVLRHLISRITFGETPELYAEVRTLGFRGFLEQQLAPGLIDDGELDARLASENVVRLRSLQQQTVTRMIASRRQLNELMTWFWENHFNTDYRRHGNFAMEQQENKAFRAHALGRFRDLLAASAHSPAMLKYLDNASSRKRNPNENYARELLELHTIAANYSQQDIEETARAFTGWTIEDGKFRFDPLRHDDDEKRMLGLVLSAGGGVMDGERVLDLLATHPATAQRLCRKIVQILVTDTPSSSHITSCANVFLAQKNAPDQIAQVLRSIILSADFRTVSNRKNKMKTSLEFLTGLVRNTRALRSGSDLPRSAKHLGQPLFTFPVPTGYSIISSDWTNPHYASRRLELVRELLESNPNSPTLHADTDALFAGVPAVSTTEGIAARALQNANGDVFDASELATAIGVLTANGSRRFALDGSDAPVLLKRLARTVLSLPCYQLR